MIGKSRIGRSVALLVVLAQLAMWSSAASAQAWPTRPIRLIIPFAAGGVTDLLGRIVANGMSKSLGQPVILENKSGAAGVLATEYVAKSEPDGYTLCLCTSGPLTVLPFLNEKLSYDPMRDLVPISHLASVENVLVARSDIPASTFSQFIALAKSKSGGLTYGSPGSNGTQHLAMASLFQMVGIGLVHAPYKGEAPLLTDLMGRHIDVGLVTMAGAEPLIKDGKIKAFAVMAINRSPQLTDVPSIAEVGYPAAAMYNFLGVNAPAGTPKAVVDGLAAVIEGVMRDPGVQHQIRLKGAEPVGSTPAEYAALIKQESERWERVVKSMKDGKL